MCKCSQEEYDCGLFSIAFATALVFGEQPGNFLFDQKKMRAHLIQCVEVQQITPFPIVKRRRDAACLKVKVVEDIPVYCLCRMPELPDSIWVECSACKGAIAQFPWTQVEMPSTSRVQAMKCLQIRVLYSSHAHAHARVCA